MSTAQPVTPDTLASTIGSRLDGSPLAIMLDVDGTIAPIAPTPQDAVVPQETRDVLHRLVRERDVRVVLVSGRSAEDAARIAAIDGAWTLGNHGMELRDPDAIVSPDPSVRPYENAVTKAAESLSSVISTIPGVILENKRWSLSLHYRRADDAVIGQLERAARAAAVANGLAVTEGRKVFELRPPIRVNKGTASVAMAERLGALSPRASVLFAGDDRTDEDAFVALRGRKADAVTIRIATSAEQATDTEAEFALTDPAALRVMLDWLAERRAGSG